MNSEIALLQDIKTGVWILVYIVGLGMISFLIRNITVAYKTLRAEINSAFYNAAYSKFESGNFNELLGFCHEQLKKKPKDIYAYWFLAKAHYELQQFDKARECLDQVSSLAPSWESDYVGPLRAKVDAALSSTQTT